MYIGTKPTLTLLTLLVLNSAHAQNFAWAVSIGGSGADMTPGDQERAIRLKRNNDIYTVRSFIVVTD